MPERSDALAACLSRPRIGRYLRATQNDLPAAIALYHANARVGAAIQELSHYVEVSLRNMMDERLSEHFDSEWWFREDKFKAISHERQRSKVEEAIGMAIRNKQSGSPLVPGQVIAELSLGFWANLLAKQYTDTLWTPALKDAFPKKLDPRACHGQYKQLTDLRNRIAHHEPIIFDHIDAKYRDMLTAAGRISTVVLDHMRDVSRFEEEMRVVQSITATGRTPQP